MVEMDEDLREMVLATMVAMDWRVRIEAEEKALRVLECRRICEEELRRVCEGQNRKNSLQMKQCLRRLNEYLEINDIEATAYDTGPYAGRCKRCVESVGCVCEVVPL